MSGWTPAETIEMPGVGEIVAVPSIGVDREGNVFVVWMRYESGRLFP